MVSTAGNEPAWVKVARSYEGLHEIPGKGSNPIIQQWLRKLNAWWSDDAVPWCGTFAGHVMQECGYKPPQQWYRARAWLNWGIVLPKPLPGCISVYTRGAGGHVGFIVGVNHRGWHMLLGGNQGDQVCIMEIDPARALGHRWPVEAAALVNDSHLPLMTWYGTRLLEET